MNENEEEISNDREDAPVKGRSFGKANEYDNPIGLTQAFAPIDFADNGEGDPWDRAWSNAPQGDSDGWDQIVPDDDTPNDWREPDDGEFSQEDEDARRRARPRREHHTIVEYDDIPDDQYEAAAAGSLFNEGAAAALAAEKAARAEGADAYEAARAAAAAGAAVEDAEQRELGDHAADSADRAAGYVADDGDDFPDMVDSMEPAAAPPVLFDEPKKEKVRGKAGRGKHASGMKELSVHERKSRKVRKTLLIVIAVLVVLVAALCYFAFHLFTTSQTVAVQQISKAASTNSTDIQSESTSDSTTAVAKKTDVPDLAALLGKTQDEAVTALAHGAQVRESRDVNDEGSPIKKSVTVALTDEPADTKTGTPTVYLSLNEEGKIIQAGYSTSTSSLGYGAYSFTDMVEQNHVVERTLQEANVMVNEGAAVLPKDKMEYSTYASDGTTLTRERYSFSGDVDVNGQPCTWSSVLSYDYSNANLTGNLANTVRVIYVYVSTK